jgi:alpha-L-fucosidase 2
MTESLPIGNGPMGAMLFGGTDLERIQFNEISLWSGDRMPRLENKEEEDMGYYQAFGDIFIRLGHDPAEVRNYLRQLDIDRAIHDRLCQPSGKSDYCSPDGGQTRVLHRARLADRHARC